MQCTTPSGFRDVLADEAREREALARRVLDLLDAAGYAPIETPTLELLDVMEQGGRVPATPFKFLDAAGQLVTLRPDVTLQVARMGATRLACGDEPLRFRYMQRVFREASSGSGQQRAVARERKQIGIECIGAGGPEADAEVISLFARSLQAAGVQRFQIALANVAVLRSLLAASQAPDSWVEGILNAFHSSSYVALDALCEQAQGEPWDIYAAAVARLARIAGGREAIDEVRELVGPLGCADALDGFEAVFDILEKEGLSENITIDFSVMSSFDYYTGIVFEAYAQGMGGALGAGGRYDQLLGAYGNPRPAAGFAFFLEDAMAAREAGPMAASDARASEKSDKPLRVAVPKGSLNADAIEALAAAGLDVTGLKNPGRQLIIRNPGVEYIIVRPTDAPVFVELGAADCGICGEDSLLEAQADVVELSDLRFGACRFIVAQLAGSEERVREHYLRLGSIRVATKYPRIARAHFAERGQQVEIVELRGNIELGPLTGMSECIVDITATGTTLRENNLVVTDEVLASTARFFANKSAFRTDPRIRTLARTMTAHAAQRELKVTPGGTA